MRTIKELAPWGLLATVVGLGIWLACLLGGSKADSDAAMPLPKYLENPELRKELGMSIEELSRSVNGPGYDVSNDVEPR